MRDQEKNRIVYQYDKLLKLLELRVNDDGTIEFLQNNGYVKKLKYIKTKLVRTLLGILKKLMPIIRCIRTKWF